MKKGVVTCLLLSLTSSHSFAQRTTSTWSHFPPQSPTAVTEVAAPQPVNSDASITLLGITLGAVLPPVPDCATDWFLTTSNALCRSTSLPAYPPYSWVNINNAPIEHAHLSVILYKDAVESVDSVVEGPGCDPVLRALQRELGQATVYQTERKQNSHGYKWRAFKWYWHTTRDTWVYYSKNLSEPDVCVLTALIDIPKP